MLQTIDGNFLIKIYFQSDKLLITEEDDLDNIEEPAAQNDWQKKSGSLHVNLCHQIGLNEEFNKI